MRLLVYNIAYATGAPKSYNDALIKSYRALKPSKNHFNLLHQFISDCKPDIIGLVEVDIGSYRTGFNCQVKQIAKTLNYDYFRSIKYKNRVFSKLMPIMRKQGNAVLAKTKFHANYHYFKRGVKKLVIEVNFSSFDFFLVHLALSEHVRKLQVKDLENIVLHRTKPTVIAGDFNTFRGHIELEQLIKRASLRNANRQQKATFPSWKPVHQLDYVLHSNDIKITNFIIPKIHLSDHLPIIVDFEVNEKAPEK